MWQCLRAADTAIFIFPGQRMRQELLAGSTPGTDGTMSPAGWSNMEIFMSYLTNHFPKYAQGRGESKPILVLYDEHRSHISLPLIDWARNHNVFIYSFSLHIPAICCSALTLDALGHLNVFIMQIVTSIWGSIPALELINILFVVWHVRHTARHCLLQIS